MAPRLAVAPAAVPLPAPAPAPVARPFIHPTPSSSSSSFPPSLPLLQFLHFRRDNGENAQCPPHTNACDPSGTGHNNNDSSPSSTPSSTSSSSFSSLCTTPVTRFFFAAGFLMLAMIVGLILWFIYRRRANKKVFPCCSLYSTNRAIRQKSSSTRRGTGLPPLNANRYPTDEHDFPPGLSPSSVNYVPMDEQDSNGKWRPLEEFSSFDVARNAPIQIHVVRQVDRVCDSLSPPASPLPPSPRVPSPTFLSSSKGTTGNIAGIL